ncbi:MAG: (d)CMP kinase [Hyphomicrobiaceae bacterium]
MRIAVDGPAASGKGTLAKRIATHFGLSHLDTGLLYRAVARDVLVAGRSLTDGAAAVAAARALDHATLADPALRERPAGEAASLVARIPEVRAALLDYQRAFASRPPGAVLDGRDIGTVVLPDADVKIFVTASSEERARRRWNELVEKGSDAKFSEVHEDIRIRDRRDRDRSVAPLVAASDAILLDTTDLDIEGAFRAAVRLIEEKTGMRGRTP